MTSIIFGLSNQRSKLSLSSIGFTVVRGYLPTVFIKSGPGDYQQHCSPKNLVLKSVYDFCIINRSIHQPLDVICIISFLHNEWFMQFLLIYSMKYQYLIQLFTVHMIFFFQFQLCQKYDDFLKSIKEQMNMVLFLVRINDITIVKCLLKYLHFFCDPE